MFGPCLCGDIQCPSCGPAQGNWKCCLCGSWADEECIHINPRTGRYKKRYMKAVNEHYKAEAEYEKKYAEDLARDLELIREFVATNP
jgi:hypothetical protein